MLSQCMASSINKQRRLKSGPYRKAKEVTRQKYDGQSLLLQLRFSMTKRQMNCRRNTRTEDATVHFLLV
jgi:hypothetical protein